MADTRILMDAITTLADIVAKADPVFEQAYVETVYAGGDLDVRDERGRTFRVSPVTDENIEAGNIVWIGIAADKSRFAVGLAK